MTYKIVVLIRSNPQESHRASEGIRIALGLAAGEHEVEVILTGNASLLLAPDLEDTIDGEMTEKFLASLKEFIPAFYIDRESSGGIDLSESDYKTKLLSSDEIAEKIAAADRFATF